MGYLGMIFLGFIAVIFPRTVMTVLLIGYCETLSTLNADKSLLIPVFFLIALCFDLLSFTASYDGFRAHDKDKSAK